MSETTSFVASVNPVTVNLVIGRAASSSAISHATGAVAPQMREAPIGIVMTAADREDSPTAGLSHVDSSGEARMVDVSAKKRTLRRAVARGSVRMRRATCDLIVGDAHPKGSVLGVARIAGIQAAKNTGSLIPLCHSLPLAHGPAGPT